MLVYRLEIANSILPTKPILQEGVYRNNCDICVGDYLDGYHDDSICSTAYNATHPTGREEYHIRHELDKRNLRIDNMFYGFESEEQLNDWFYLLYEEKVAKYAAMCQLSIYEIADECVIVGERQCIFETKGIIKLIERRDM